MHTLTPQEIIKYKNITRGLRSSLDGQRKKEESAKNVKIGKSRKAILNTSGEGLIDFGKQ